MRIGVKGLTRILDANVIHDNPHESITDALPGLNFFMVTITQALLMAREN